ncbi:hypothetical protein [Chryseobacterium profundimaris]|uniref:Glycine zipper domain-containing protein n=1 Tax=Chryseobacterium profundimaris TaxID=1387275 RepID=A0ABY1NAK6_9FLAO|nr:hypothetical protein [Chryseobacterium profundimaris]SMP04803.1 hypothetical protein SAMN06264346_101355 [Chryseobacterium profundimaris]
MRKSALLILLIISTLFAAQKSELIKLNENIKDKNSRTKSITLIDNRPDKNIGTITDKEDKAEIKFEHEDLKSFIENKFIEDNKKTGTNDIVIMLEDLKGYDEQDDNKDFPYAKAKIRISAFLKRNDRYYFINRFDNVIVCNPKTTAHPQRFLVAKIGEVITEFIKASYFLNITGSYIPESEIKRYDEYLGKDYKAFNNPELKDGVYLNFKSFREQNPNPDYYTEKNRKGNVVRLMSKDVQASISEMYCYVEGGKAYKLTPVGFDEMVKDQKGFYIHTSRVNLFFQAKTGGAFVGAITGGLVGAVIGAAIDSASSTNSGAMNGIGYSSTLETDVYIDSLTGGYVFTK